MKGLSMLRVQDALCVGTERSVAPSNVAGCSLAIRRRRMQPDAANGVDMAASRREWLEECGLVTVAAALAGGGGGGGGGAIGVAPGSAAEQAVLVAEGKHIFRFDTFGDEAHWTDTLRMHEVISTAVAPTTALAVGLKVDSEA